MMPVKLSNLLLFTWIGIFLGACSATKSVREGDFLYTGAKIDLGEKKDQATSKMVNDVYGVLNPTPNSRIAGLPLRLYLYQLFDNGKEKGLLPWARDMIGQAPVLFKEEYPETVEPLIANRMFNNGYFDGKVESEVKKDGKKAEIIYHLDFSEPYYIDTISNAISHPAIKLALDSLPPSNVLKSGDVYTLSALQAETERVEEFLKGRGFYSFNKDYLQFEVDSTDENHNVNLKLVLRENTPPDDLEKKYLNSIVVLPDFEGKSISAFDHATYEGLDFFYGYTPHRFRQKPLADNILFRPGDLYNINYHFNTLKRLVNLNTFSFVNVQYKTMEDPDSLNMVVSLSPRNSQNIQGSVGLSYKNSKYFGPDLEITYSNRNLFKGAENLRVKFFLNINFPTGSNAGDYYERSGMDLAFSVPRLMVPFYKENRSRELSRASSKFNLTFQRERVKIPLAPFFSIFNVIDSYPGIQDELAQDTSYAPFLGIGSLEFNFGYQWQRRPQIWHEFDPIGLGLQFGTFQSRELKEFLSLLLIIGDIFKAIEDGTLTQDQLDNIEMILRDIAAGNITQEFEGIFGTSLSILLALEDMVYWKPSYSFTFDSREKEIKRNNYYYRGRVSFTGNVIVPDRNFEFFETDRFQSYYFQLQNDFRYFRISPRKGHTLAGRLVVDVSYPFGAELFLPFLDLFSVAGPNSVRAYSLRELGPGTTQLDDNGGALTLFAGRGDIHLESSLEYRYKITRMFELAAFADAGNVWVLRSNTETANFRFNSFIKELGFGVGLGLRLNINPLVLRLDLAMPLTKPWLPEGERWVGNQIDLFYGGWRKENIQFNLSFGYPF